MVYTKLSCIEPTTKVMALLQHIFIDNYYCCACSKTSISINKYIQNRGVETGGATGARAPPIFCALALAAASHARTTRNATGDLYLRRHNCPKCPQNAPKNCLKSQFYGGHAPRPSRLAALRPVLAPPVIFIFLRPCRRQESLRMMQGSLSIYIYSQLNYSCYSYPS